MTLLLTNRSLSADQAAAWGLVDEIAARRGANARVERLLGLARKAVDEFEKGFAETRALMGAERNLFGINGAESKRRCPRSSRARIRSAL